MSSFVQSNFANGNAIMSHHLPRTDYPRFHLAFPVTDLGKARAFYGEFIGCTEGRSSPDWVDFDFFGHQIVAHKVASGQMSDATSLVDGDHVPVRHFGVVLSMPAWDALATRFRDAGVKFVIDPHIRFRGEPGEQATMFFLDPFGNALEFKAFADEGQLFAT
jgi:extradiol dioxygenase family protein